jgi:hypothetical protein
VIARVRGRSVAALVDEIDARLLKPTTAVRRSFCLALAASFSCSLMHHDNHKDMLRSVSTFHKPPCVRNVESLPKKSVRGSNSETCRVRFLATVESRRPFC